MQCLKRKKKEIFKAFQIIKTAVGGPFFLKSGSLHLSKLVMNYSSEKNFQQSTEGKS